MKPPNVNSRSLIHNCFAITSTTTHTIAYFLLLITLVNIKQISCKNSSRLENGLLSNTEDYILIYVCIKRST